MNKLTEIDKKRFNFNYIGKLNDIEVTINITDKISNQQKKVLFISIYNMTNEAIETILKENIEKLKQESRNKIINNIIQK